MLCYNGSNKLEHIVSVPVSFSIISSFKVNPATVFFGVVSEGNKYVKAVTVSSDQHFSFVSATSTRPEAVTAMPISSSDGNIIFQCTFNSKGLRDNQSGRFLITMNEGSRVQIISIPFIAYVQ